MKKSLFVAFFALFSLGFMANTLVAQDARTEEKYTSNLKKAMLNLDSSWVNPAKMRETANQFERLANFKKGEWIPKYYQALCLIQMSWSVDAKERPTVLETADKVIKSAMELSKDNSELVSLEGYMYQAMIMINPMTNGAIYGPKSAMTLQKAMELDPANPRPHYLLGQNTYFTPEMWGGGMEKARPHLEKAMVLYAAFKPASEFSPNWGEIPCKMILDGKMGK